MACSLDGRALSARQDELRAGILGSASSVQRLPDGWRWTFAGVPDLFARLAPVVDAERRCCRFLRITLTAAPDLGAVTLDVTGPGGTADFLESWIAPGVPRLSAP